MARQRKNASPEMNETEQKVSGMKSISSTLDLGNDVTVATGEALLATSRTAIDQYNSLLAQADEKLNEIIANNKKHRAFNKKVLPAVGLKYGTDSNEYEMVGGVRDSERKKPGAKKNSPEP